jgi:hypothetical protein
MCGIGRASLRPSLHTVGINDSENIPGSGPGDTKPLRRFIEAKRTIFKFYFHSKNFRDTSLIYRQKSN